MSKYEVPELFIEIDLPGACAVRALDNRGLAIEWLVDECGVALAVAQSAARAGTVGWVAHGAAGAFAAIVRDRNARIAAVELRFMDPAAHGGHRFRELGCGRQLPWTRSTWRWAGARSVHLVSGVVDALRLESAGLAPDAAVLALRGSTAKAEALDLQWVLAREVLAGPGMEGAVQVIRNRIAHAVRRELVRAELGGASHG